MKTIAYLDCPSGISGDMCLGALIDAGVPLDYLQAQLSQLGLDDEFTLSAQTVIKRGQRATQANVALVSGKSHQPSCNGQNQQNPFPVTGYGHPPQGHHHQGHDHSHGPTATAAPEMTVPVPPPSPSRNLSAIVDLISQTALPERIKTWSVKIFQRLGAAEAAVHGIPVEQVHFHEVGATDAIVDIVGSCLGFDYLNIDGFACSPLPTGQGRVNAAHGWLPIPAPAVLKLMELKQVPLYSNGLTGELVTPTGAAIVTTLAQHFGEPPPLTLEKIGLGAGCKDLPVANILRLWVGKAVNGYQSPLQMAEPREIESSPDAASAPEETVAVLETQVDDLIPQAVSYLYDQLFAAGALDVFTQPIGMKKSRPGLLITVICPPACQGDCEMVLFQQTTTLGIRHRRQLRTALQRKFQTLTTRYGPVAMKLAYHPTTGQLMNAHPEYEDCATLARRHQVPWQTVHQTALAAWAQHTNSATHASPTTEPG